MWVLFICINKNKVLIKFIYAQAIAKDYDKSVSMISRFAYLKKYSKILQLTNCHKFWHSLETMNIFFFIRVENFVRILGVQWQHC